MVGILVNENYDEIGFGFKLGLVVEYIIIVC